MLYGPISIYNFCGWTIRNFLLHATHAIEEWKCKFIEMIDRRRVLSYLPWFWVDNCFPFPVPVCPLNHCTVLLHIWCWCIVCLIHWFSFYNALLYFCLYSNYFIANALIDMINHSTIFISQSQFRIANGFLYHFLFDWQSTLSLSLIYYLVWWI